MAAEKADAPTVCLKPSSYQPSKAELEEDVRIVAAPEDVVRAVMSPVDLRHVDDRE